MNDLYSSCKIIKDKEVSAKNLSNSAIHYINNTNRDKINVIWIEAAGCSGNIISLLDAADPDIVYLFEHMVSLKFNNSIMLKEGELAFEDFLKTLNTEFILIVDGAISIKDNGKYNIIANYKGNLITAMEAVKIAGEKAKFILSVGTCASFGGISAAKPNPSNSISVESFLKKEVINLPGCPCNPDWLIGTIAHIILFGNPNLDNKKRPIGDNTPCIGCANERFPDGTEPFIRY